MSDGSHSTDALHVGIVIPCYNAGPWISKTIDSALAQSEALSAVGGRLSVVAVDDGSTDDTLASLERYGETIVVESGPNRGACHARNRGFALASERGATHVVFLDADDYLEGPFTAGLAETAQKTGAAMVMGNMHLEFPGENGGPDRRVERFFYSGRVAPEEFFIGWMKGEYVNPSGLLWSAALVRQVNGWDENLARAQDLDITLRAMLERPHVEKSEAGAAIHARVNVNSISNTESVAARESRLAAFEKLLKRIPGTEFAPAIPLICYEAYAVTRNAFRDGLTPTGRKGVAILHAAGWRRHYGSKVHVILSSLLGLERKVALTRRIGLMRRQDSAWEQWSKTPSNTPSQTQSGSASK